MSPPTFMSYKSRIVGIAIAPLTMDLLRIYQRTHNRLTVFCYENFDIVWFLAPNLGIEPFRDVFSVWDWIMLSVLSRIWDNPKLPIDTYPKGLRMPKIEKKLNPTLCYPVHFRPLLTIFWRFLSTLSINWIAIGVW